MYTDIEDLPVEFGDILSRFTEGFPISIDCESGWHHLILKCNDELKELAPDYKIAQIKQKMGGLRYYISIPEGTPQEVRVAMNKTVAKYESIAWQTSEISGRHGYLYKSPQGELKTLNPDEAPVDWVQVRSGGRNRA